MNIDRFKPLLKLIHQRFYQQEQFEYFLNKLEQSNTSRLLIFKTGFHIVKPVDGFNIQPTLYEVYLDLITNDIIFEIGNFEVSRENYTLAEIMMIFTDEQITVIMQPNENDILKYLKTYRLINPNISIGTNTEISKVMNAIQDGKLVQGQFYQKILDEYRFIEVEIENNQSITKLLRCPTADHLAFALAGGGNIGNAEMDVNEMVYNVVNRRIISMAKHFNEEVLLTLLSIETGITDYNELSKMLPTMDIL